MTWPALPLFVRVADQPVILLGKGEPADAKRRLLERAGALVVADHPDARLAFVAIEDEAEARAAADRLRARGLLVNVVDRSELCDMTVPAIVDRSPVLVAIGTGGVSAGLAAAVRQRLEGLLPATLGLVAEALHAARAGLRTRFPDGGERRRAIGAALAASDFATLPAIGEPPTARIETIRLRSPDPDDITLRQARWLSQADRVCHTAGVPPAILDRARADAPRSVCVGPPDAPEPGLTIFVEGP